MVPKGEADWEGSWPEAEGWRGLTLALPDGFAVDELVLAYRDDGELVELAAMEPPVYAELKGSG